MDCFRLKIKNLLSEIKGIPDWDKVEKINSFLNEFLETEHSETSYDKGWEAGYNMGISDSTTYEE